MLPTGASALIVAKAARMALLPIIPLLVHLQDRFRLTGYSNVHENSDLRTFVVRRRARKPPKGAALHGHFHHASLADTFGELQRRARPEDRLKPRMRLANGARRHPRLQRKGSRRPRCEILASQENPRRIRPEERRGFERDAPPLSEGVRIRLRRPPPSGVSPMSRFPGRPSGLLCRECWGCGG